MKLILTSAWNPAGAFPADKLAARRKRFLDSLDFYARHASIDQVIMLDATLSKDQEDHLNELGHQKLKILAPKVAPSGQWRGTSYLEALLFIAAQDQLMKLLPDNEVCLKVTGGYVVKNLDRLLDGIESHDLDALGFLHQNPLRLNPRFAMTSFIAMHGKRWQDFIDHLRLELDFLRTGPLEAAYSKYLLSLPARRGPSLPYPRLDAYFNGGKMESSSAKYQMRELAWRCYARAGIFVLSSRAS